MPFEPAPQVETKPQIQFHWTPMRRPEPTGRFKRFADAMLRGCEITTPCVGAFLDERLSSWVPWMKPKACALGAMRLAMGREATAESDDAEMEMRLAYIARYYVPIELHNDSELCTREQIAARIAAL